MTDLDTLRSCIRERYCADENDVLDALMEQHPVSVQSRQSIQRNAIELIERIRASGETGLMEQFMGEYGLSTHEGLCLMTLAEALLRVPDQHTVSLLIQDKIGGGMWADHVGRSASALVNFSTRALVLTRQVLDVPVSEQLRTDLRKAVKRLGEPVIRRAVRQAMVELGKQFVLGETVEEALSRGMKLHRQGYRYSYDMLGEAALTAEDAQTYLEAYSRAIEKLAAVSTSEHCRDNPGISVKLSALHPRYEFMNRDRVMRELVPIVSGLARQAAAANMGFNIDAEEANRLDLSLDIIEAVLEDESLAGWDGFGVVIQAYGRRCMWVLDWLYAQAKRLDRKIMVRLVKGAYWDTEIKVAQVLGVADFPVFTHKAATDVAYISCARQLLHMNDRIYSQFATHNAHTVAAILELADERTLTARDYEFQRLHGMGEALHDVVRQQHKTQCRIYAPVGSHKQLLAYLVRRLLENGANSSFVNQMSDPDVPAQEIASCPFDQSARERTSSGSSPSSLIALPAQLYAPERENARGWDIASITDMQELTAARAEFAQTQWHAMPLLAEPSPGVSLAPVEVANPAELNIDIVGSVRYAGNMDIEHALACARIWDGSSAEHRQAVLLKASYALEEAHGELFALLAREAGKSIADAIAELREAVDFMRYYGVQATQQDLPPRGVFACISPWNFPLAIFLGQVSAAIAMGNAVICKCAESTTLVAFRAVQIMHEAGVPKHVLQLLPGLGAEVGRAITSDPRIHGVCFTGSTAVAQQISASMATRLAPDAPLIAETGGLNAMIIDSTALPEQAIRDVVASAFQSAGQRCSALRILCIQEDIFDDFTAMLFGAMDELKVGVPWHLDTDVGPIINAQAHDKLKQYIDNAAQRGLVVKQTALDKQLYGQGYFIAPTVVQVKQFSDVAEEIFGPVLHIVSYKAQQLDELLDSINASGYGLTFGLHTRIEARVEQIIAKMQVGNIYVNRNQIGAVVGSQPFGGEGLSGTGPKAGGPHYLPRFGGVTLAPHQGSEYAQAVDTEVVQQIIDSLSESQRANSVAIDVLELPGPTGESNILRRYPKGLILCLGPSRERAIEQSAAVTALGCSVVIIATEADDLMVESPGADVELINGVLEAEQLELLTGFAAVVYEGPADKMREYRIALSRREGLIIPLLGSLEHVAQGCVHERHVCIDTTAAGGNAHLMSGEDSV